MQYFNLMIREMLGQYYPARRVKPYNLWIGSQQDSTNRDAATRHNIGLVVNCTRTLPFKIPNVAKYRVPVDDTPADAPIMAVHLPEAVAIIDEHLLDGQGVLVHCHAGVSRSASVVAAYLMSKEGLTPEQAIAHVKRCKPETFSNGTNFIKALRSVTKSAQSRRSTCV